MKQLPNFDLSIVVPLGDRVESFVESLPLRTYYYERNGIEVVLLVDEEADCRSLLACIRKYLFISWKIVSGSWQNRATAYNEGIRQSIKEYVLLMFPESLFQTDVIYELRETLDEYPLHYAVGFSYGSLMVKKEYLDWVGGYDEQYNVAEGAEENLCRRMELADIHRLYYPEVLLQPGESRLSAAWKQSVPEDLLYDMLLPIKSKADNRSKPGSGKLLYDWQEHPYAKEQCREYLSKLKQFDIPSDEVFEKSYPLIALIPTYNESERITDCLRSVEKYCDGIILLDDDSLDDTYEIAQSEKLLLKAKKVRTKFNDKQNRNMLLDMVSFFKAKWFIFIDADERFDDRFVDLREVMKRDDVDTVGVWIANLWNSMEAYRTDMEDTNLLSQNGLWFRWRMFRNKGRMQFIFVLKLHFMAVPYIKKNKAYNSKTLLLHLGYLNKDKRLNKYNLYQYEDELKLVNYDDILSLDISLRLVKDISL
ncbi:glycosyltransferase family 2 protein [Parabacteroides goldsteinii]|jgi:hypothetical protein|uniref:Glycosyltransferase 2-like domain-containing protein n=1 Tax=Parabacteroides goldsteinii TaxID=328812 RepID=A0A0J6C5N1_9BACT|nr:glycosyltransferase [Parabacteroides goldsteinii]KMM31611.1 hypothetical protein ACM15_21705 [Parabacteroides goldsteinii]